MLPIPSPSYLRVPRSPKSLLRAGSPSHSSAPYPDSPSFLHRRPPFSTLEVYCAVYSKSPDRNSPSFFPTLKKPTIFVIAVHRAGRFFLLSELHFIALNSNTHQWFFFYLTEFHVASPHFIWFLSPITRELKSVWRQSFFTHAMSFFPSLRSVPFLKLFTDLRRTFVV